MYEVGRKNMDVSSRVGVTVVWGKGEAWTAVLKDRATMNATREEATVEKRILIEFISEGEEKALKRLMRWEGWECLSFFDDQPAGTSRPLYMPGFITALR
jgi:hypothetical protein